MRDLGALPAGESASNGGRRLWLFLGVLALVALVAGGALFARHARTTGPLPDQERVGLLQQAGLPKDFPIHPKAERTNQPVQGGFSYTVSESVPYMLDWQRQALLSSGYRVYNADLEGQDAFLPHWLYFQNEQGARGAIIVRPSGRTSFGQPAGTEIKVLSEGDSRLIAPTLSPSQLANRP